MVVRLEQYVSESAVQQNLEINPTVRGPDFIEYRLTNQLTLTSAGNLTAIAALQSASGINEAGNRA